MGLEAILGNDRLKENLRAALRRKHLSHFYLISGPEGSGKRTLARYLSAAILCTGEDRPCLHCSSCRKAMAMTHPDIIEADDPSKKTVGVSVARQAREDMFIMPNESDYKIYLFPRADDMSIPAQNALLKVLEEPPAYGVFVLLAGNPNKLLPTIRSRAMELRLQPLSDEILRSWLREHYPKASRETIEAAISRSGGFAGQAAALLEENDADPDVQAWVDAICSRDTLALLQVLIPMEKGRRDELEARLTLWRDLAADALICRACGSAASEAAGKLASHLSAVQLNEMAANLQKALLYSGSNVSQAAITGFLSWTLIPAEQTDTASK